MSSAAVQRGDVILVDIPYLDAHQAVRRPALVIGDCNQMLDVIIAAITSRIRNPLPPTHLVVDRSHADWTLSGLRLDSVVRCDRVFTVSHASIHRILGRLSASTMSDVEARLKLAFGIQ